jgi:RNA polymerase sigma-70 factor (ECF subfamily)
MQGKFTRHVTYCILPTDLAGELHDLLRRHYLGSDVEVIVERRTLDRRRGVHGRRQHAADHVEEKRFVRGGDGRRVADRRAPATTVEPPAALPPDLQAHAARLRFIERFEPKQEYAEDQDSTRLVACVQQGDFEAFAALYERYFDRVYSYLLIGLGDSNAAEIAAQDTFAAVLDGLADYTPSPAQPFRAWLFERAGEVAADALTERGAMERIEPERLAQRRAAGTAGDPRLHAIDKLGDRELLAVLEELPQDQRQVIMLKYMLALSTREIAGVLGTSRDDAHSLHLHAMESLSVSLPRRVAWQRGARVERTLRAFGHAEGA